MGTYTNLVTNLPYITPRPAPVGDQPRTDRPKDVLRWCSSKAGAGEYDPGQARAVLLGLDAESRAGLIAKVVNAALGTALLNMLAPKDLVRLGGVLLGNISDANVELVQAGMRRVRAGVGGSTLAWACLNTAVQHGLLAELVENDAELLNYTLRRAWDHDSIVEVAALGDWLRGKTLVDTVSALRGLTDVEQRALIIYDPDHPAVTVGAYLHYVRDGQWDGAEWAEHVRWLCAHGHAAVADGLICANIDTIAAAVKQGAKVSSDTPMWKLIGALWGRRLEAKLHLDGPCQMLGQHPEPEVLNWALTTWAKCGARPSVGSAQHALTLAPQALTLLLVVPVAEVGIMLDTIGRVGADLPPAEKILCANMHTSKSGKAQQILKTVPVHSDAVLAWLLRAGGCSLADWLKNSYPANMPDERRIQVLTQVDTTPLSHLDDAVWLWTAEQGGLDHLRRIVLHTQPGLVELVGARAHSTHVPDTLVADVLTALSAGFGDKVGGWELLDLAVENHNSWIRMDLDHVVFAVRAELDRA